MGTWGTAIFSDDLACDIRDDYIKEIIRGKTSEEATQTIKSNHFPIVNNAEEQPVFWIALALTQWKKGRLLAEVKDEAILAIDSGADLLRWESEPGKIQEKRKNELEKAKQILLSPMPPAKKIPIPSWMKDDPWQLGDLISYRITNKDITYPQYVGQYVILRIVETRAIQTNGPKCNFYAIYNWCGDRITDDLTVKNKPYFRIEEGKGWYVTRKYISVGKKDIKEHDMKALEQNDGADIGTDEFLKNGIWDGAISYPVAFDDLLSRLLHSESINNEV